jgi:transposase-like protein
MNTMPLTPAYAGNGTGHSHEEKISAQAQEPKATQPAPKSASAPVVPTKRAKASRIRYSLEDKRRILRLVDACTERGQIGAILRRDGIYYTTLRLFQQQREKGLLDSPAAKKNKDSQKEVLAKQLAQLQRENRRLQDRLEKAEIVIDFQKKLSRLLESAAQEENS